MQNLLRYLLNSTTLAALLRVDYKGARMEAGKGAGKR